MNLTLPILKGSQDSYNSILTKDASTIYITTDKKHIYLGDILLGENYVPEKTIKNVSFDTGTQTFTFIYTDDSTLEVDLVLESVIKDINYDSDTHKLAFTLVNGSTTNIDLTDLIDVYTVNNTDTVSMDIENGEITSEVNISDDDDNSIEIKSDGLYVAPTKKPVVLDNIVIGSGTDIKDSGKKFINSITDTTNNTDVPDVEAIKGILSIGTF